MSAPTPPPLQPAGQPPEPGLLQLTDFYCPDCRAAISLPAAVELPTARRRPCPFCHGNGIRPGLNPFAADLLPPPLPRFITVSEESDDPMDLDDEDEPHEPEAVDEHDIRLLNPVNTRRYVTHFIQERLSPLASPEEITAATAAALALLEQHLPSGVPPAPAASIAALPTVEVSDHDAECAICMGDLPLASAALKLPCSHLFHSRCITSWLQRHNSCPMCRSSLPVDDPVEVSPPDMYTTITIRLTARRRPRRVRVDDGAMFTEAQVSLSSSPTQLAQAGTGEGAGGPANSGDTVSSEWPPQPDSDAVMSEPRDDGDGSSD